MSDENLKDDELYLIYIHKVGTSSKGFKTYEFIFSDDPSNIDSEGWGWDKVPACDNADIPTTDYYQKIYSLNLIEFDLSCLHDAVDREYMHGYYKIHALAYEIDNEDDLSTYDKMFGGDDEDEPPLLVFHYNTSLHTIKEMLYERNLKLKEI